MKNKIILLTLVALTSLASCEYSEFEENYTDPSKVSETSVEKQFTGFIIANRNYVLPSYTNYFVNLRITLNRYTQATGWVNEENQYVPGSAAVSGRWNDYYQFLAQYRELEKVYAGLSDQNKEDNRVFMITATTYLYDHTQKIVDLHGAIPFSEAGMLSTNGGDYSESYPAYDEPEAIYTKMLDDLAGFADELRTLDINPGILIGFESQDLINRGDIDMWLKYINSLRIRMLTRVSGIPSFSDRAASEINAILSNPGNYPIVTTNDENITFRIHELGTLITSNSFQTGLEDWEGNIAGKAIVDHMLNNDDPRLTYVFEPGEEAEGEFLTLDPLLSSSVQTELIGSNTMTIYNRTTLSRNQYFPGMLINASQIHFMVAEYYLKEGQDAQAKEHYESGVRESIHYYEMLRNMSNNLISPEPMPITEEGIDSYLADEDISWDAADGDMEKMRLIAEQKWLHFNVVQPNENWAELRRIEMPDLEFWVDQSNQQSLPPNRWIYPGSEQTYNTQNYQQVQPNDNLTRTLFWDN
ncbi:SusD/RagB family nutrient-binding outer membrane lipoprotein [Cyclobacterium plantarum]|uniref:SusD/RagB family nutrient-binding outer membrane lipoprotein n=1 Tax=Cyclobacterium plantarum TaxID=2716263 RepID=A0ABX0HCZ1_9BACT|nr:SusD/RagB family nutrient-binding outer membrane lipoprotein [Cyclobacterium plantarum]NHE58204.1 SusD/RagB family nutrient-binding outer membrane lipoprotein [Cyclobacterium plantarum]